MAACGGRVTITGRGTAQTQEQAKKKARFDFIRQGNISCGANVCAPPGLCKFGLIGDQLVAFEEALDNAEPTRWGADKWRVEVTSEGTCQCQE